MSKKKGLNVEKTKEILSPVEEIIDKLAKEDEKSVEPTVEPPVEQIDEQIDEQMVAHQNRINEIRGLLDLNIKKAILYHKDDKSIGGLKYVT